jgi:hypothetical protein
VAHQWAIGVGHGFDQVASIDGERVDRPCVADKAFGAGLGWWGKIQAKQHDRRRTHRCRYSPTQAPPDRVPLGRCILPKPSLDSCEHRG